MAETEHPFAQPPALSIAELEARMEDSRTQRERHARLRNILYPFAVVIGLLVVWEAGTRILGVPDFLLPPPSAIAVSFIANSSLLLFHGWITTVEILLGFALSIVVGIPLALAIFLWPTFSRSILPLLVSSQAMPKVAVAPLFLVWFGFGLLPKVLIAFLIAFFPVVINTAVGLASIEPEKIYLARSMGFGWRWLERWWANSSAGMPASVIFSWWRTAAWIRSCSSPASSRSRSWEWRCSC
jgi:NitT/TauT family transport system permease protein